MIKNVILTMQMLLMLGILVLGLILARIDSNIIALTVKPTKPAKPKIVSVKLVKPHKYYIIDKDIEQGRIVCKDHEGLASIRVDYVESGLLHIVCNDTLIIGDYKYGDH